jgi:SPP1 family predicted phage head-tail adaptor
MIDAGRLNRRVKLLQPAIVENDAGETDQEFEEVDEVWAEVKTSTGSEIIRNGQTTAALTYKILIRWRRDEDVNESWRIGYAGRELEISQVLEYGNREGHEILAHESRTYDVEESSSSGA